MCIIIFFSILMLMASVYKFLTGLGLMLIYMYDLFSSSEKLFEIDTIIISIL
jgi:hypothetical protein